MSDTQPYQRSQPPHAQPFDPSKGGGVTAGPSPPDTPPSMRVQPRFEASCPVVPEEVFTLDKLGRTITSRLMRSAKRGNLPFLFVFVTCLVFFFSALAGIGYVDPELSPSLSKGALGSGAKFMPGAPVYAAFQGTEVSRRKREEEMRALEQEWQKKKRPQDGAWMQKQRDTKAVKRVPVDVDAPPPSDEVIEHTPDYDKRELMDEEKDDMYDWEGSKEAYKVEEKREEPVVVVERTKEGISIDQAEQEAEELKLVPLELQA